MPCLAASAANSRLGQWLIGCPASCGDSPANAITRYHGSAVMVSGAPGRGRSDQRARIASSARSINRLVHWVTLPLVVPSRVAMSW